MSIVLTKAALALKNSESNFQVIKFESHKPKKKSLTDFQDPDSNSKPEPVPKKDVDLKKLRHEIVKFGMSGFNGSKKEEAQIALAVSLGAKPPKNKYVNYKELMQKRKDDKRKENEEKQQMLSKSVLRRVGKSKSKRKAAGNDVGNFLSGYGKVQKKDIKKDQSASKKKRKK